MADDDSVTITFSADTSQLDAAIARAKAQLAGFNSEIANFARQVNDSAQIGNFQDTLEGVSAEAKTLKSAVAEVEKSTASAGVAFGSAGLTASYLTRETRALLDEASSGRWRQFDGTVVNLATHVAQFAASFAAANPLVAAFGAAAAAAGGYLGYLSFEALRTAEVFTAFKNSLALSGQIQLTDTEITALSEKIRNLAGVTHTEADEIVASFGRMQNQSKAVFEAMAIDIAGLTPAGGKAGQTAKELESIFSQPADATERLIKLFGSLTDAERDLLGAANATGDITKIQAANQQVIEDHLEKERNARQKVLEVSLAQARASRDAAGAVEDQATSNALNYQIEAWEKELNAIKAVNDEARKQAGILDGTASSVEALRQRFDDVLKAFAPWTTELEKVRGAAAALAAGLSTFTSGLTLSGAQSIILGQESNNGRNDKTSVTGAVGPGQVEPGTFKDFARPGEDINNKADNRAVAERIVEAYWKQFNGDITRVAVAYFSGAGNVAPPGSPTPYLQDKKDPTGKSTSSYVQDIQLRAAGQIQAPSDADLTKIQQGTEARNEQLDKINEINARLAGGTEIDKARLANLEQELAGRKNAVAEAERLVAATTKQLGNANSIVERTKLQSELEKEQLALKAAQSKVTESGLDINVVKARGTGDDAAQHDAAVALANFKLQLAGQDVAAQNAAIAEKTAADNAFAESQKQTAERAAQDDIRSVQSATKAKIELYGTEAKARQISESQKLELTRQALAAELQQEQDILNKELQLQNLRPEERKKILDQLAQLEQNYAQQVKQTQAQAAEDATKSWESFANTIDGAINSQLKAVLSHAESFRTAMAKVAEDLAMKFAEKGEQIATNWLADQAAMKAGASMADLGSELSTFLANAAKAIAAGAGQTAAGVSGFLAPVLGPGAVPIGLAAGAAVESGAMGIGMMDIGAWNVPENQMALIHKNELVMPSAEAGAFRAMLSGASAGGSGQSSGGDTHIHNYTINGAQSPQDTAHAVAKFWDQNPSRRPRY